MNSFSEGIRRCKKMVEEYDLNSNIVKYLKEKKLYYSYGYSIDTIHYDPRYADAVIQFEYKYNAFVYHAIEYRDYEIVSFGGFKIKRYTKPEECSQLILLYVGNNPGRWPCEEISNNYAKAYCCNFEDKSASGFCYVELSAPNGYITCDKVQLLNTYDEDSNIELPDILYEIYRRISILQSQGMQAVIDIKEVIKKEPLVSYGALVYGHAVGLIFGLTERPTLQSILKDFVNREPQYVPFLILYDETMATRNTVSILFVSYDADMWADERERLELKCPVVFEYDLDKKTCGFKEITYLMCNGGPIQKPGISI